MSFDELSKLASTMPPFHDLWISGGEPFLRKDLATVIQLFYNYNHVRDARIPTNGLPTEQTVKIVKTILETCPELELEVDVSIDGFAETHDRIRGVEGNFKKALQTIDQLEQLRPTWPNFTIYVNTVITQENKDKLAALGRHFQRNYDLDGQYFQIIRGDPKDPTLQTIQSQELKQIYESVLPSNIHYISKPTRKHSRLDALKKAFWKAGYIFSYDTQLSNYSHGTKWKMPCTAGQTSIVIDYNADVRVCELRKPIGNLRQYNMEFNRFWNSVERRREVDSVGTDQCFCTHICFMYDSMRHSKRVMLWELPKLFAKQKMRRLTGAAEPQKTKSPTLVQIGVKNDE
jgi:MoaA/NifB/PqqE/SkfB family radical SAM enzyme